MLRRIHIRNFKSLRDVEFVPGRNNVFVGPNGSGKSNIFNALSFLTLAATRGLITAATENGGFSELLWKGEPASSTIAFEADIAAPALTPGQTYELSYAFQLEIAPRGGGAIVAVERLTTRPDGRLIVDIVNGHGFAKQLDGAPLFQATSPSSLAVLDAHVPNWVGTALRLAIANWRFYDLIPQSMLAARNAVAAEFLTRSGDNLGEFLLKLKVRYTKEYRSLENAARDLFPGLEEIFPTPTQAGKLSFSVSERGLRSPVPIWNMPHGELVAIALLALICAPPEMGSPLSCIEEPESHLHPSLIQQIVPMLLARQQEFEGRAEAVPTQLFATTHSPYVVDAFPPDALWLVAKDENGETRLEKPAGHQSLKGLLEQGGLGDLAFSGALAAK